MCYAALLGSCCFGALERTGAEGEEETRWNKPVRGKLWNGKHPPQVAPIFQGRTANPVPKQRTKCSQAFVSHGEANFGDRQLITGEKLLGAVNAQSRQEIVWRLAKGAHEHPVVVKWRETCFLGGHGQRDPLVQTARDKIARAIEPRKRLLLDQWTEPLGRSKQEWIPRLHDASLT